MASLLNSVNKLRGKEPQYYTNFQKIEKVGTLQNIFCKVSIMLAPKPGKDIIKKKKKTTILIHF